MFLTINAWIRTTFFNLLIVAFIGLILRYKIVFSLPFIDQKQLLHAHSHFAFTGWVTQLLMTLMIHSLSKQSDTNLFFKYRVLLITNLVSAFGMLFSFAVQGYSFVSISFSTLSIIVSWVFAIQIWKDVNNLHKQNISAYWFKSAVLLNAFSAIGAFALVFMMANKIIHQNWHLLSVYFFLHFQYNGWFFFACMGLIMNNICIQGNDSKKLKIIFWIFTISCIPTYFLSVLWLKLQLGLYILVVLSAIAQLIGWGIFIQVLQKNKKPLFSNLNSYAKWLLILSTLALSIKLLLQLGSTIPSLSELAYGFRPIVIGYLHLILLGAISLYLIGYSFAEQLLLTNKLIVYGLVVFTAGVIINELFLMTQGIAAMNNILILLMNECLIFSAIILFLGMVLVNIGLKNKQKAVTIYQVVD